jgi:two-component system LytT family response regulator
MINFILYEDKKKWQEYYKKIILNIIGPKKDKYKILIIDKYTKDIDEKINSLVGKKIFLLDLEVPGKLGLDFAREIRNNGDWLSPIIIITSHESFKKEGFTSKILMLDFIIKDKDIAENLTDALNIALKINTSIDSFKFTYNNEYYQIPYDNILFFEKDLNNNYTLIITESETYKIKESIKRINEILEDTAYFYKTHRSCIVNLKKVKKVNFNENFIYFTNNKTNLLSRDRKKGLKEELMKVV